MGLLQIFLQKKIAAGLLPITLWLTGSVQGGAENWIWGGHGGLGAEPSAGSKSSPSEGSGGEAPLKLKHFSHISVQNHCFLSPLVL
jgi:hypothetical protein